MGKDKVERIKDKDLRRDAERVGSRRVSNGAMPDNASDMVTGVDPKQAEFTFNEQTQAAVRSDFGKRVSLFRTRDAAGMMSEWTHKPRVEPLLYSMWMTGEMAVCFGERGSGKSILAVQIADALVRGKPLTATNGKWNTAVGDRQSAVSSKESTTPSSETDATPPIQEGNPDKKRHSPLKQVLYFDFELSRRQFEARYSGDLNPYDTMYTRHYSFSPGFLWSEIDPCITPPKDYKRFEDFVLAAIEAEVRSSGARVVIIDNIDRFNGEIIRNRDIAYVMSRLKRLKAALDLSILVLAHLPRRNPKQPLAADRVMATRTLCAFADSVFAVGQCRWDERLRYLKHLKSTTTDIVYDAEHVPTFLVYKQNARFLSFNFEGFRREDTLLDPYLSRTRLNRSDRVKELAALGYSRRSIALSLNLSLGSVNRSLQMWSPFDEKLQSCEELQSARVKGSPTCPTKIAKTADQDSGGVAELQDSGRVTELQSPGVSEPEAANSATSKTPQLSETSGNSETPALCNSVNSSLTPSFDGYGHEIFVEKFGPNSKPDIWYRRDRHGKIHRSERRSGIIHCSIVPQMGPTAETAGQHRGDDA